MINIILYKINKLHYTIINYNIINHNNYLFRNQKDSSETERLSSKITEIKIQ
jgi:hypothetical protein